MTKSTYQTISELIKRGELDELKYFFKNNRDQLFSQNSYFGSAIHLAAMSGNVDVLELIIILGADPNATNEAGDSAMNFAIESGSIESIKCLLRHGARLNLLSPTENPLLCSIIDSHVHLVKFFLELGVDPHVIVTREDGSKRNALSFAIEREETEIVELLKQHGCTVPPDFESDDLRDASDKEALIQHVEGFFGTANALSLQSVIPTPGNINIHYIRPSSEHPFSTVFTNGMSEARMEPEDGAEGYDYAELVWHLPESWPDLIKSKNNESAMWPLQVMRMVGSYPHVMDTWLGPIPTLSLTDPPQPLGPNTKLSSLLLIPDEVEPLETSEKTINFYTVYPIYDEELDLVHEHGIDALLDRLKANHVSSVLNPDRINTAF